MVTELLDDLAAEHDALDAVVRDLSDDRWDAMTPGGAWRVRDQIGHLAFYDEQATLAARDPAAFEAARDDALADLDAAMSVAEALGRELTGRALLDRWRADRGKMLNALAALSSGNPSARLPWYGPPMSLRSFATARLMETWAHGQDVCDGLGLRLDGREATDRLRHVAFLGCATRGWSYAVRGRAAPESPVWVELELPSGDEWTYGEPGAADVVRGPALDFCLVVTQRRNVEDTSLSVTGDAAAEWLSIAQAFAGPPTLPPAPGSRG